MRTILNLTRTCCRWPSTSANGQHVFAYADPALEGRSYYADHYRRATLRPEPGELGRAEDRRSAPRPGRVLIAAE
jgi:hypothetical protein